MQPAPAVTISAPVPSITASSLECLIGETMMLASAAVAAALDERSRGRVSSRLLKNVLERSGCARLIQHSGPWRTKDSAPRGPGFENCASLIPSRVFQQPVRSQQCPRHRQVFVLRTRNLRAKATLEQQPLELCSVERREWWSAARTHGRNFQFIESGAKSCEFVGEHLHFWRCLLLKLQPASSVHDWVGRLEARFDCLCDGGAKIPLGLFEVVGVNVRK